MSSLSSQIESILFWKGEPESIKRLADILGEKPEGIRAALDELEQSLAGRGVRLLRVQEEVSLVTAPESAELIEKMRKDELERDLGKAGAETLAVVLYRGPSTRSEIEFIRGVNCSSILRSLAIRGLVEKAPSPERKGSFIYTPTSDLLATLGVSRIEELPEYAAASKELRGFEEGAAQVESATEN